MLLVHPGGPLWVSKDDGAWSIPKGEFGDDEQPLAAAQRECAEELGRPVTGDFIELESIRQRGGKVVHAWAVEFDLDPADVKSNTFRMEWPPRSGRHQDFPEVDRAEWFDIGTAGRKILKAQAPLLKQLWTLLGETAG